MLNFVMAMFHLLSLRCGIVTSETLMGEISRLGDSENSANLPVIPENEIFPVRNSKMSLAAIKIEDDGLAIIEKAFQLEISSEKNNSDVTHRPIIPEGVFFPQFQREISSDKNNSDVTHRPIIPEGVFFPLRNLDKPVALNDIPTEDYSSATIDSRSQNDHKVDKQVTTYNCSTDSIPAMCGNYNVSSGQRITIASPSYPDQYPSCFRCSWKFQATDDGELTFHCVDFQLDFTRKDFLGVTIPPRKEEKYRRMKKPPMVTSKRGIIKIRFYSNRKKSNTGFLCYVWREETPTTSTFITSSSTAPTSIASTSSTSTTTAPTSNESSTTETSTETSTSTTLTSSVPSTVTSTSETLTESSTSSTSTTTAPTSTESSTTETTTETSTSTTLTSSVPSTVTSTSETLTETSTSTTMSSTVTDTTQTSTEAPSCTIRSSSDLPLSHPYCGCINSARIVNGYVTSPNRYPWMVWTYLEWNNGKQRWCGATIIQEQWILTAAHCPYRMNDAGTDVYYPSLIRVTIGAHDHGEPYINGGFNAYVDTNEIHLHPKLEMPYDIALYKLEEPLIFSRTVAPICLSPRIWSNKDFEGVKVTLAGWGKTESGRLSTYLRDYDTTGYSFQKCKHFYGSWMTATQMCTNGKARKHSCSGDSGGPVMRIEEGRMFQIGVISFGSTKNCNDEFPQGQVKVASFIDWIERVTNITFNI